MAQLAAIALGSNLGESKLLIEQALSELNNLDHTTLVSSSKLYSSTPLGFQSENAFINSCCTIKTQLDPGALLYQLQKIELSLGRSSKTTSHYEDRVIDLDLIFYGKLVLRTPYLTIPHPLMHVRNFVLEPLSEIANDWTHPLYLKSVGTLLLNSPDDSKVHAL